MRRNLIFAAAAILFLAPATVNAQAYGDPGSLVDSWYRTYLGRPADSGLTYWVNHLQQGDPPDSVLAGILGSDEYYKRGGGTPDGFVSLLFRDIVKRQPSPSEMDFWVRRQYTEDRQSVADEILTQNPGVWVGAGASVVPPPVATTPPVVVNPGVIVTPGIDYYRYHDWVRDRHYDWDAHRGIHDYRRPYNYYHHDAHHDDHHHDDHHH
jgi:hypothetical protein